ncbi:MAG: hypothetical protein M3430_11705 [Acidobacteriota bacterium]|nr:hypothetical protein [Acidobacteriota bacterium]
MPQIEETKPTRRDYVLACVVTLAVMLVVGGIIYLRMSGSVRPSGNELRLERALREGAPEFEGVRERIIVEELVRTTSTRGSGDAVIKLSANVRNETGRGIGALEMRGEVMSVDGQVLSERVVIVMPAERTKIPPGESLNVRVVLEGVDRRAEQADVRMEVVGVRFD